MYGPILFVNLPQDQSFISKHPALNIHYRTTEKTVGLLLDLFRGAALGTAYTSGVLYPTKTLSKPIDYARFAHVVFPSRFRGIDVKTSPRPEVPSFILFKQVGHSARRGYSLRRQRDKKNGDQSKRLCTSTVGGCGRAGKSLAGLGTSRRLVTNVLY